MKETRDGKGGSGPKTEVDTSREVLNLLRKDEPRRSGNGGWDPIRHSLQSILRTQERNRGSA